MVDSTRILVFHRNQLFRDCLRAFLQNHLNYDAMAIDHAATDQVNALLDDSSDLVLLDLNLPDELAIEITRSIQDRQLASKVILLVPDDHDRLVECIAAGTHGCIHERSSLEELRDAVTRVLQGETFCSSDIVATMFSELARFARGAQTPSWRIAAHAADPRLTGREREVLELLAKRQSNKEIASELSVSLFTIKNHVHNILEKLQVESRVEAVEFAKRQAWLSRT